MEGSKTTTPHIDHLSSPTKSKQKTGKMQPYGRNFVVQQYMKSL